MDTTESQAIGNPEDVRLVEGLLARDRAAWHELERWFERLLRRLLKRLVKRIAHRVLDSEAVNDIVSDLHVKLVEDDMRRIRMWLDGPRTARFGTWLTRIATNLAIDHIRRAFAERRVKRLADIDEHDDYPNRGGAWIAMEHEPLAEAQIMSLLDEIVDAEVVVVDAERRLVFAWYGGAGVNVYDEDGTEVDSFTVGGSSPPTVRRVRAAIERVIAHREEG
jgi:DNA-directed RNA polymerase specialized sigma24 family protein